MTRFIIFILSFLTLASLPVEAKKTGYKLSVEKQSKAEMNSQEISKGSFMVASHCRDCNNGYTISQIIFTGYDKPQNSSTESFFIMNNTDRTLTGINLYIEYFTTDGELLTKRYVKLSCNIPPGERRIAEVESWDKQHSFHYCNSRHAKGGSTPYTVSFDPISFYLRY